MKIEQPRSFHTAAGTNRFVPCRNPFEQGGDEPVRELPAKCRALSNAKYCLG